jgi:3-oxoacyl-[acyl-carrier-protein] synthase II
MPHPWHEIHHAGDAVRLLPSRVVVTGIGLATALGLRREETWSGLCAGRQAFQRLEAPCGGRVVPYAGCPLPGGARGPLEALLLASREAMDDAGLRGDTVPPERVATVIGLSKGDLGQLARARNGLASTAADWRLAWPDAGAVAVASSAGLRGPSLAPIAACATGLVAALHAADLIRRGVCDVALAGAGDSSFDPLVLASFRRMGILAPATDDPNRAMRPWDKTRAGFLVGEGAGVLVLERAEHAEARRILPYVELAGGALGADAFHATNLNPDPTGLALLIAQALARADVAPRDVDHVNVHGTATRVNDPLECRALRKALGPWADQVACSANKAQIGHLLGAAGAVELALTCLAVRDAFVAPTMNLDQPDPACDLDATPHVGRARTIRAALKLSLGFGGHLAVAVLRQPDGPCRGRTQRETMG